MACYPVRTVAGFRPVTGDPSVVTVRGFFPVALLFNVAAIRPRPFGSDPYVMRRWSRGAFHDMFVWNYFYIIVLGFGFEAAQEQKSGAEKHREKHFLHRSIFS